ncbi:Sister chromatid cohesion protein pds5 [Golovinomyces cichoracearum]|uniref:Sister chromatid cohesion protein pds5 n=1 Tax=Golovinomyces cichoracearum TaxID=62708 RepID=A0A420ILN4_9PEZI|nr:Sister chromatid cohesion protein pds5 [Golovinomyces cichoracearum]
MVLGRGAAEESQTSGLKFNRPLSWRAGKPIQTCELLKRLESLSLELKDLGDEQEEVYKNSLTKVAKELAGQHLLVHRDKGVRAFTACCLVDILKICAPNAPFTPSQLKEIFTLFITSILPALSNPSHAYNQQHKYVLASLAEVKSIVLICDIPNSDSLVLHLFSNFFDIMSGSLGALTSDQIPRDVEFNMTQVLIILVDEAQNLPSGVVDIIVAQFLRASVPSSRYLNKKNKQDRDDKQSTLLLKELPAAYNMAKTICNSCSDKMARYVSQYFNEVIIEISSGIPKSNRHREASDAPTDSDEGNLNMGPNEADMKELQKAHNLLRELWRASPLVLQNVIPQLEQELSADDVELRLLATETLGDIISGIGAAGPPPTPSMDSAAYPPATLDSSSQPYISDSILTTPISPQSFAQTYPHVYRSFFSRKNDKSVVVRSGWTTAVGRILVTSAGGIGLSVNEEKCCVRGLAEKLHDSDEKVRLSAVREVGRFSFRHIMSILAPYGGVNISGSVLGALADRARDRKHIVRVEAMNILCRMWGVATGEILRGNDRVNDALGMIPTKVFDVYYANDLELNVLLDHSIFEQLLPLNFASVKAKPARNTRAADGVSLNLENGPINTDKIRTERILLMVDSLDSKSKKAFFAMQARQQSYAKVLEAFLSCCEEFNGGVVEQEIKKVKARLEMPIKWFMKVLPDPTRIDQDLHKFAKLHDRRSYQLLRFATDPKSDFTTVHNAIKELRKRILSNQASTPGILDTLIPIIYRSACLIYNISNQAIISQYARTNEHELGATANIMMQEISEKHPEIFQASLKELCKLIQADAPSDTKPNSSASVETLKSLASFTKSDRNKITNDSNLTEALIKFSMYGTPPRAAKYAVIVLTAITDRKEMYVKDLLEKSLENLQYDNDHFLTKLALINQLTMMAPTIIEESNTEIINISRQILLEVRTESREDDPDWQADSMLDKECQAKSYAIKILVSRLRSIESNEEMAKALAIPVFRLLNSIIDKKGQIAKAGNMPKHHKARLRLLAAKQILKLCTSEILDKFLYPLNFYQICFVAQDPLEDVRRGFVGKLQKYLVKNLLPNRFLTIIFITAFEPSRDFQNSIMTWIRHRVKLSNQSKNGIFEAIFPRLLHLLAYHPDYSPIPHELLDHGRYILYYISTVASEENLPLIYKYAQRVKQARDALPGADSDRLYTLSDLAQALIRKWEEKKGWSMQSWPKQVGLPVGLFASLSSHEVAQQIAEKTYTPEDLDNLLDGLVREFDKKQKRRSDHQLTGQPSKKAKTEKPPRNAAVKRDRLVTAKKTPKQQKASVTKSDQNTIDRRRSERSQRDRKIYEERDSSEDDEEMWEGVAEWEYFSKDGRPRKEKRNQDVRDERDESVTPIPQREHDPSRHEDSSSTPDHHSEHETEHIFTTGSDKSKNNDESDEEIAKNETKLQSSNPDPASGSSRALRRRNSSTAKKLAPQTPRIKKKTGSPMIACKTKVNTPISEKKKPTRTTAINTINTITSNSSPLRRSSRRNG